MRSSQNSIDPNAILPPCSMTTRGNADKIEKDIVYPLSVNFTKVTK